MQTKSLGIKKITCENGGAHDYKFCYQKGVNVQGKVNLRVDKYKCSYCKQNILVTQKNQATQKQIDEMNLYGLKKVKKS